MAHGEIDGSAFRANLAQRLRSAEGHLRAVTAMIERGDDCETVVRQLLAVQAALHQINQLMLRHHLAECLGPMLPVATIDPAASERWVGEVINLYDLHRRARSHSQRMRSGG